MDSSRAEQLWLLTIKMAAEAKEKGVKLSHAFSLLRNAKSLLNEARLDEHPHKELVNRAESLIDEAQREVFLSAEALAKGFEEKWEPLIKKVLKGQTIGEFPFSGTKFYPGMPRGEGWARLALGRKLTSEKVKELAKAHDLGVETDKEGYAVLTGDKASIKKALKAFSNYYRST